MLHRHRGGLGVRLNLDTRGVVPVSELEELREKNKGLRSVLLQIVHEKQVLETHIARQSAYIVELLNMIPAPEVLGEHAALAFIRRGT